MAILEETLEKLACEFLRAHNEDSLIPPEDPRKPTSTFAAKEAKQWLDEITAMLGEHRAKGHRQAEG